MTETPQRVIEMQNGFKLILRVHRSLIDFYYLELYEEKKKHTPNTNPDETKCPNADHDMVYNQNACYLRAICDSSVIIKDLSSWAGYYNFSMP